MIIVRQTLMVAGYERKNLWNFLIQNGYQQKTMTIPNKDFMVELIMGSDDLMKKISGLHNQLKKKSCLAFTTKGEQCAVQIGLNARGMCNTHKDHVAPVVHTVPVASTTPHPVVPKIKLPVGLAATASSSSFTPRTPINTHLYPSLDAPSAPIAPVASSRPFIISAPKDDLDNDYDVLHEYEEHEPGHVETKDPLRIAPIPIAVANTEVKRTEVKHIAPAQSNVKYPPRRADGHCAAQTKDGTLCKKTPAKSASFDGPESSLCNSGRHVQQWEKGTLTVFH